MHYQFTKRLRRFDKFFSFDIHSSPFVMVQAIVCLSLSSEPPHANLDTAPNVLKKIRGSVPLSMKHLKLRHGCFSLCCQVLKAKTGIKGVQGNLLLKGGARSETIATRASIHHTDGGTVAVLVRCLLSGAIDCGRL